MWNIQRLVSKMIHWTYGKVANWNLLIDLLTSIPEVRRDRRKLLVGNLFAMFEQTCRIIDVSVCLLFVHIYRLHVGVVTHFLYRMSRGQRHTEWI